jgi:hypothetical protein
MIRRLAQYIGVSTRTTRKICRDDLSFPYKMQLNQPLSEDRIEKRYVFAREYGTLLEDNPGVLNIT